MKQSVLKYVGRAVLDALRPASAMPLPAMLDDACRSGAAL